MPAHSPSRRLALAAALLIGACGLADEETADAGCPYGKSQQLSAPCCLEHGIDACGAMLLCAALDGRTQPTCYPERSRADQAECTHDALCASGSCNAQERRCRSAPSNVCDAKIGCAPDDFGYQPVCGTPTGAVSPICHRTQLPPGAPCNFDYECRSDGCSSFTRTCY